MKGCRSLNDDEIRKCLLYFNECKSRFKARDKCLFYMGLILGFRMSELLSLKIDDVYKYGKVVDDVYLKKHETKGKIEGRCNKLNSNCKRVVIDYINFLKERCDEQEILFDTKKPLFQSQKGNVLSYIQAWKIYKKCFKICELDGKLATHTTRKTIARKVYDNTNHDLVSVQKVLGHKSVQNTGSYLSFNNEKIEDTIENQMNF